MSRSYKKTPWCGDHKGTLKKRFANKYVRTWLKRHPEETLNGGEYRKVYETWDICDYGYTCTWEEYWEIEWRHYAHWFMYYREPRKEPDKKAAYRRWRRFYRNKQKDLTF